MQTLSPSLACSDLSGSLPAQFAEAADRWTPRAQSLKAWVWFVSCAASSPVGLPFASGSPLLHLPALPRLPLGLLGPLASPFSPSAPPPPSHPPTFLQVEVTPSSPPRPSRDIPSSLLFILSVRPWERTGLREVEFQFWENVI